MRPLFFALVAAFAFTSQADPQQLIQLIDYVSVDYAAAVHDGVVISELEYGEMQEFAGLIRGDIETLNDAALRTSLSGLATELTAAIEQKSGLAEVERITRSMREHLLAANLFSATPTETPDLAAARDQYQSMCASCHGSNGKGDGEAGRGLEPAPTDFTDRERAYARTIFGLYNTISMGVADTGMASYSQLTDNERWALAFLVSGMHIDAETAKTGEQQFASSNDELPSLDSITTQTLGQTAMRSDDAATLHAYLRLNPEHLFAKEQDPMQFAITSVDAAIDHFGQGNFDVAYDEAVAAYLEGFELVEPSLRAMDGDLLVAIENRMSLLRNQIRQRASLATVTETGQQAIGLLRDAQAMLGKQSISASVALSSSLIILLREGLEAVLILGAIAAFLRKTGQSSAMPWMHAGWIGALVLGGFTWIVSNYLITISGSTRELTEGITALLAAVILFYVGFWMHSKLSAQRWQQFIQEKVQTALDEKALWTITLIAFIAVYREVFETVLFYQALWTQVADDAARNGVLSGFVIGVALVLVAAWAIFRFGVRLPLKSFFGVSAVIMISLAVIFAGKGVAALQEAGSINMDPVNFIRIEMLGIYPNVQSLAAQCLVVAAAIAVMLYNSRSKIPAR